MCYVGYIGVKMRSQIVESDVRYIAELIKSVLHKDGYKEIKRLGGLTNHSYKVVTNDGQEYVFRIPGEGTEEMIVRSDEEKSTRLANKVGVDAELYYFGKDGTKISEYVKGAVTMTPELLREPEHIAQVAEIFHKLHTCGEDTGVPFEVFDMAKMYEDIIYKNNVSMYYDYDEVKKHVEEIKNEVDSFGVSKKVPCHCDSLCENWVLSGDGRLYLIDWEYSGMNDAMWDLADISIEADYDEKLDEMLLKDYFGREATENEFKRFIANKIYLDYLWTLWGKTRVPFDGQMMEDYAYNRYVRLKKNIDKYLEAE